jgi:20S proteasome alpha/beta subunit
MQKYIYLWLLSLLASMQLLTCQVGGFSKDGSLEQVSFAQVRVFSSNEPRSVVGIKYRSCTVLIDILEKLRRTSTSVDTEECYNNGRALCFMTGDNADCAAARLNCNAFDSEAHAKEGRYLGAARMSLLLADNAQRRSMGFLGRPLAVNALVVNCDPRSRRDFGDIFVIDTTGSFYRAKAASIGPRSGRTDSWLGTRGRYLASQWLARQPGAERHQTDRTGEPAVTEERDNPPGGRTGSALHADKVTIAALSASQDMEACIDIAACCLRENMPADLLASGNCTVAVTVLTNGTMRG